MHCKILRHTNVPLTLVVARARYNHRLRYEALLRRAKRLHRCGPRLTPTDGCGSVGLVLLGPRQVLDAEDVFRSSRKERSRVRTIG